MFVKGKESEKNGKRKMERHRELGTQSWQTTTVYAVRLVAVISPSLSSAVQ